MGLDIVEVVMRCEEIFDVHLSHTSGADADGWRFIGACLWATKLPSGAPVRDPIASATLPLIAVPAGGWSRDNVWIKLVQISWINSKSKQTKSSTQPVSSMTSAQTRRGTYQHSRKVVSLDRKCLGAGC